MGLACSRHYHPVVLSKEDSHAAFVTLPEKPKTGKKDRTWRGLSLSKQLTKQKYCCLMKKTLGLPRAFRNPYYALSFYTLFSPDRSQLRVEHLQKGVKILTSGSQAEKAAMVFDWLDRNHDGFLTRADLEQGLISSCKLLCDSLSYWLWLYTPKELLKHERTFEQVEEREYGQDEEDTEEDAEEEAYMLIETLQKLIPAESFLRFLDTIFFASSDTGTISREEWIFPGSFPLLTGNFDKEREARRDAIEWFVSVRCGDILSKLTSPKSILSFRNVTPSLLTTEEFHRLETYILQHKQTSLAVERILLLRNFE